jgi:hypothetical protein
MAVIRGFGDGNGGALVVTVLGFLLGRDSGFQQRLPGSAVAEFPIIGDQVQDNIHGLRSSGDRATIGRR